ncbi:MAG: hypothetical protein RL318_249 [Fibrobacterota bacterium]|jgi:hypothetical protein
MRKTLAFTAISALLMLSACKDKEEVAVAPPPPKPKEFSPPADGKVTPERVAQWKQADSLVRLVDSVFLDSIRKNSGETSRYLASRDAARDAAAKKAGLLGWKEYAWVLETAARNGANAQAFEKAGASIAADPAVH